VAHPSASLEWGLIVLAILTSGAGILIAYRIYSRRPETTEGIAARLGPVYHMVRNLYWVDELYEAAVLRPFYAGCRFFSGFDRWVVDGAVNAVGVVTDITAQLVKLFQTGYVRNYALLFLGGVAAILFYLASV
jgi:NADH-quinone oxidoreductase subunit L